MMAGRKLTSRTTQRNFLAPREDTQFGAHLSNMEGKRKKTRSRKQSHNKENDCVPEVASGCIGCRKQRLENEGLIQKIWRKLYMAYTLLNIIKEVTKTKPAPGVLDVSSVREFNKSARLPLKRGPTDNDQHSPVKRRKPSPSSTHASDLKHINESKHLEGTCLKRRREEGSPPCSSRRRLEYRPEHPPDTQFGAHLSNMEEKRKQTGSRKQSHNKEIHCVRETCEPEVDSGCISCREQRLEIEGLKNKIKKLERRLNMAWELSNIIKETVKTKPAPGVLDASSLVREFNKSTRPPSKRGPTDNDQHSPVKRRKPTPSSSCTSDLKHINESKHLEGTCVKRRREEGSPPSSSNLEYRPDHPSGTSDKDQCSTVERKGKCYIVLHQCTTSVLRWSGEASDDIGVMSDKSEVEIIKGIPENEVLEGLATKIPKNWKALGRRLMEDADLDAIDEEEEQLHEKAYAMLVRWKRAQGEGAIFSVLYEALCHPLVHRKDLAIEFCCVCHN